MPPSHRRPGRPKVLILVVCAVIAVAALSIGGWIVASGSDGDKSGSEPGANSSPGATKGPARLTTKKGAALNPFAPVTSALADSGVSWYYDWDGSPQGIKSPPGVQYVPMIWGDKAANDGKTLAAVKKEGDTLLGFNEPDFESQSNMSPDEALKLWPKLEATGMRLGSPAPANGGAEDGSWFDEFMKGAEERGYRIDFIALHWYGGNFETEEAVEGLKEYLQAVYDKYHKPIWLTEYALINFANGGADVASEDQQVAFVKASTQMLDGLSFVERYSWFKFSPPKEGGQAGTTLYNADGSTTPMGDAYREAG
ncbi:glycoside hydrolase family protein [Cryptosporangium sp. NPDC051539]|uniref:glycoside hydrolase family protein n=1 Tax=Cryptosporangium sp. NPDC051539 TaxID=3363962 RepID=UPI00378CE8DC